MKTSCINSRHLQLEDAAAPQPANMSHYDDDTDGRISTKEFELGLGDDVTFEEALQAHIQADVNGKCRGFVHYINRFGSISKHRCTTLEEIGSMANSD